MCIRDSNTVISCNNDSCRYFDGFPIGKTEMREIDPELGTYSKSEHGSFELKCVECNSTQYLCTVCSLSFDRRRYISQHSKTGKKHRRRLRIERSNTLRGELFDNTHLTNEDNDGFDDDSFSSTSDDDYCFFGNEAMRRMNRHLEEDLESVSSYDDDSSSLGSDGDYLNMSERHAVDRHTFAEEIKSMMDSVNSANNQTSGQDSEYTDLIDLRLIVGRALGIEDKAERLSIHPIDACRHIMFTNLMESLTESKRKEILVLLQLDEKVRRIISVSKNWKKTNLSMTQKTLNKVNMKGPYSIKKALNTSQVKHQFGTAYSDVVGSIHTLMMQEGPSNTISTIIEASMDETVSRVIECEKMRLIGIEMQEEALLEGLNPEDIVPVIVILWDDGFDTTAMKSGISGLNMGTLSVLDFDTGNMSRLRSFTDVISLSRTTTDHDITIGRICLLYTSPSPRDATLSRMPSSA